MTIEEKVESLTKRVAFLEKITSPPIIKLDTTDPDEIARLREEVILFYHSPDSQSLYTVNVPLWDTTEHVENHPSPVENYTLNELRFTMGMSSVAGGDVTYVDIPKRADEAICFNDNGTIQRDAIEHLENHPPFIGRNWIVDTTPYSICLNDDGTVQRDAT